jgi:amino acid adenylation domain-containing protein
VVQLQLKSNQSEKLTVVEALDQSFASFGSATAIDAPQAKLSYNTLDQWSRNLALEIQRQLSKETLQSRPIAIFMSRSIEFYVAEVAILRAGGFFLPIDPQQPSDRVEFLLADSEAALLLVRTEDKFHYPETTASLAISADERAICFQTEESIKLDRECEIELETVPDSSLAYMIYTSGSTGQPKGVAVSHKSLWNFCDWWANDFEMASGDRTMQFLSLGFDASLEEIFPALISGGTLVPLQPDSLESIGRFLSFVEEQQVNVLHLPTAFWNLIVASLDTQAKTTGKLRLPDSLTTVIFGGEQVDAGLVKKWFDYADPKVRLVNVYGPTEATIACSCATLRPDEVPSIGKPIDEVDFYVVDDGGALVDEGQIGELYICGIGLANKYWRREELSAEKFVACDFANQQICYRTGDQVRLRSDGNYEFVGRIDDQIKLRGYRIEPGEIANCLSRHPRVKQAHVMKRMQNLTQQLVGYVVTDGSDPLAEPPGESDLREFVSQHLPDYMVPSRIVFVESFPTTANGKLDYKQLPDPTPVSVGTPGCKTSFKTVTEEATAKVWERVLGVTGLNRDHNFFELGGDSLLAMRLVLSLESEFPGPHITVASLIPNPTIAAMSAYLDRRHEEPAIQTENYRPLLTRLNDTDGLIRVVYLHAAGGGGMFYHEFLDKEDASVPMGVLESSLLYGDGDIDCSELSIKDLAESYVDCIVAAGCEPVVTLVGYSFGGLLAFEMTPILKSRGFEVDRIINIDAPNPLAMRRRGLLARLWRRISVPGTLSQRFAQDKDTLLRKLRVRRLQQRRDSNQPLDRELRLLALEVEFIEMANRYEPNPCDVAMDLIYGEQSEPNYSVAEDYGWREYVSSLTLTKIPGSHATIFSQPYLEEFKKAFRTIRNRSAET